MESFKLIIFLIFSIFSSFKIAASELTLQDYILKYEITIDTNKPSIIINWENTHDTRRFCIARKEKQEISWGEEYVFYTLGNEISQWEDTNIKLGVEYEYSLEQYKDSCSAYSYFSAGIDLPLKEYKGGILILVDSSFKQELFLEIKQLEEDIIGDGWSVCTRYVPRSEKFDKNKVQQVKNIILAETKKDTSIKALLIIGRVPVPYSGNYAVDLHIPEHCGAWGSDTYYQSLTGNWTDESPANEMALEERIWNLPGDGKFDNDLIPEDLNLECGRVDMYNLTKFDINEVELLRRYLTHNHNYKNFKINYPTRAIINDYFKLYSKYEAFAGNAWMNFIPLVGGSSIDTFLFNTVLTKEKYLFTYACGPGSYQSCYDAVYTDSLIKNGYNTVFSMLFGSWFGDWDSENNLMRSMLAADPPALVCAWAGRPYWHIHHLGTGNNIGYSAIQTQNNNGFDKYISNSRYGHRGVHIALLGDPTLRMHVVPPVEEVSAVFVASSQRPEVHIHWKEDLEIQKLTTNTTHNNINNINNINNSNNNIMGYNIYRAKNIYDKFEKLNTELLTTNNYIDTNLFAGEMIYQVRAVKKEQTKTSSYWNQSIGKFVKIKCFLEQDTTSNLKLDAYVAPNIINFTNYFTLVVSGEPNSQLKVELYDINGNTYGEIFKNTLKNKTNNIFVLSCSSLLNLPKISPGLYYLKLKNLNNIIVLPIFIL